MTPPDPHLVDWQPPRRWRRILLALVVISLAGWGAAAFLCGLAVMVWRAGK